LEWINDIFVGDMMVCMMRNFHLKPWVPDRMDKRYICWGYDGLYDEELPSETMGTGQK